MIMLKKYIIWGFICWKKYTFNVLQVEIIILFDKEGFSNWLNLEDDCTEEEFEEKLEELFLPENKDRDIEEDFVRRNTSRPEAYNSFLLIPTIYEGYYSYIKKVNMELWYLGNYRPSQKYTLQRK